jgi:hypothetical protein
VEEELGLTGSAVLGVGGGRAESGIGCRGAAVLCWLLCLPCSAVGEGLDGVGLSGKGW